MAAEKQAAIDGLHDQAAAARDQVAELIRGPYARLAAELVDLMLELERLDEVVLDRQPQAHGGALPRRRARRGSRSRRTAGRASALHDGVQLPARPTRAT